MQLRVETSSGCTRFLKQLGIGCALFAVLSVCALAQDSHYWTNQFGNRARLLGGAVIGGAKDLSAVYYNPGALALVDEPELLLAGRVVEITRVGISSDTGEEKSLGDTRLDLAPSLFAGEIKLESRPDRFAYSFLTRQNVKFRIRSRVQKSGIDLDLPDTAVVANDFFAELDLREYWMGGTWARKIGKNLGFGVSTFLAYRGNRVNVQDTLQGLTESGQAAVAIFKNDYKYRHMRLVWKIGLATELKEWELGISATTPGLGIWGSGDRGVDRSIVSQIPDEDGNLATEITTDVQKTSADYQSPFSLGGGAARQFGDTRLHLSAEWFAPVASYSLIPSEPFKSQSSGELIETAKIRETKGVLNFATGIEHKLKEDLQIYSAFHTDFNAAKKNTEDNTAIGKFNVYHLTGGAAFKLGPTDLTLGGTIALGSTKPRDRFASDQLPQELELTFRRFSLVVGFNLPF